MFALLDALVFLLMGMAYFVAALGFIAVIAILGSIVGEIYRGEWK